MNKTWIVLLALSCSQPSTSNGPSPGGSGAGGAPSLATAAATEPAVARGDADEVEEAPEGKFEGGAKAFEKVRQTLLEHYYADGIGEDELYRAATAGMLEKLEPRMAKWNKLISAREYEDLRSDLKGELVGIGAHIKFDPVSGYADILGTLPGSPSEKAGLQAGDKIVTVNGKLYKGMKTRDVLSDIRGKIGETVTLTVLHGASLETVQITRDRIGFDQPAHAMLPDGLGWVRIPSFTEKTPAAVKAALEDLRGARALVVDLRKSPGGSFDRAVETASLFLPEGTTVVTLKRKGKEPEKEVAKGPSYLTGVPIAVLVDGGTASGAEFVTAALQEQRHARVIGAKTTGKWSVQMIDELGNGYAFKYTVSLFNTPSGKNYEGVGLTPDIAVGMDDAQYARANAAKRPEDRIALDVQLRTAKELLLKR